MKLSACVIVKDEEKNLPKCLDSLRKIVSEIVIVDTGSTDNTKDVAKTFNARIIDFPWNNSFADAKNVAIEQAKGDWILFLDADEFLDKGSDIVLMNVLNKYENDSDIEAISCSMVHIDNEKDVVIGKKQILRVFRNIKDIKYVGTIHEEPLRSNFGLKTLLVSEIVIIHTGYSASILNNKFERNLNILLKKVENDKADAMTYYYLGGCNSGLGKFTDAIENVKVAFQYEREKNQEIHQSIRYQLYVILLRSMLSLGNRYNISEIELVLDEALRNYSHHPEIVRYKAGVLLKKKKIREALQSFLEAIELDKNYIGLENNDFATYLADTYTSIGTLYAYMNRENKAIEYYTLALKVNKYSEDAIIRMLRILQSESPEEVIRYLLMIYDKSSYKDVEFLVYSLKKVKLPIPLVYFVRIWNSQFEVEDESVIEAMLALGKYKDVADTTLVMAQQHGNLTLIPHACASIIMGNFDISFTNQIRKVNENAYYAMKFLTDENNHYLAGNDILDIVFDILSMIIVYANIEICIKYLDRTFEYIDEKLLYILFDLLIQYGKLELASKYYKRLGKISLSPEIRKSSLFIAGFCAYRQRKFSEAIHLFQETIEEGNTSNEIHECLELISSQCNDEITISIIKKLLNTIDFVVDDQKRLHIGCGKDIKTGWVNLDLIELEGVDVVVDLDNCANVPLPFDTDKFSEFLASHIIEHIKNPLPMMQELHRIAKPDAVAVFKCPYGSSDSAFEDPTHVRQYFLNSFLYFSQPTYWRADYGYRGDWEAERIVLVIDKNKYYSKTYTEILEDIHTLRNIVDEMIVELRCIKPIRKSDKELIKKPIIKFLCK